MRKYLIAGLLTVAFVTPALAELHEIRWVEWEEVPALRPDHGLRRALAKARAVVDASGRARSRP